MGIEPVTTRCLVAVLTTKLLGQASEFHLKPAHAVPNWQGPASTGISAGLHGRPWRSRAVEDEREVMGGDGPEHAQHSNFISAQWWI